MDWLNQDWEHEALKDVMYLGEDLRIIKKKPAKIIVLTPLTRKKYESRNKLTSLRRTYKERV